MQRTRISKRIVVTALVAMAIIALFNVSALCQNRVTNGGFESTPYWANGWRIWGALDWPFASSDACTGTQAALLTISTPNAGDTGMDIWNNMVPVSSEETLQISFAAKKLSGPDDARVWVQWFDQNPDGLGSAVDLNYYFNPSTSSYQVFTWNVVTRPDAFRGYVGFRLGFEGNPLSIATGSFLIDDVYLGSPVPEPGSVVSLILGLAGMAGYIVRRKS